MAKPRFRDGVPAAWLLALGVLVLLPVTAGALGWLGATIAEKTGVMWLRGLPAGLGMVLFIAVIRRVLR